MTSVQLRVERTGALLAVRAAVARTWRERIVGLLSRRGLPEGEAMVFPACRSIHTAGMRFSIDVLFVDRDPSTSPPSAWSLGELHWRVVALRPHVLPWRLVGPVWSAWGAIELPAGTLAQHGVQAGDRLTAAPNP